MYSQTLHLPTLVLEVASLSPSQYPCFSITLASAAALSELRDALMTGGRR